MKFGISYDSGDYWGTVLVHVIDYPIEADENDCERVNVMWSSYHNKYKIVDDDEGMEVYLLPCLNENVWNAEA